MVRTASGGQGQLTSAERDSGTGNTLFWTWEASSGETSSQKTPPSIIISASPKILPTWGPPVTQTVLRLIQFVRNLLMTIQRTQSEVSIINTCFERRYSFQFEIYIRIYRTFIKSRLFLQHSTFLQTTHLFASFKYATQNFYVGIGHWVAPCY